MVIRQENGNVDERYVCNRAIDAGSAACSLYTGMTRSTTRGSVGATGSNRTARPFEAHAAANRSATGGGVGDSVGDMLFTMSAAAAMLVSIISRAGVPLRVGLEKPGSLCPGGGGARPAHG